jgi:hypothetical protein
MVEEHPESSHREQQYEWVIQRLLRGMLEVAMGIGRSASAWYSEYNEAVEGRIFSSLWHTLSMISGGLAGLRCDFGLEALCSFND